MNYLDSLNISNTRMSIGSLHKNPTNYSVFSWFISIAFIFGLSIIILSFVALYVENQNTSPALLKGLIIANGVACVAIFLAYNRYLQNIGRYVQDRMKPLNTLGKSKCKYSTGTSASPSIQERITSPQ
jgi:uncharacterized membrane protein